MELTVLGVNGPYPCGMGACSGYLLTSDSGNTNVLIDCGSGVLGQLMEVLPPENLTAIVLTHLHFDHMSDMLPMRYALDARADRPMKVICPNTPEKVRSLIEGGSMDVYPPRDARIGEMRITFIEAVHPVEAYSVRVECDESAFVFTGDTNMHPTLSLFADKADLLLADAGFLSSDWTAKKPHLSAMLCGRLAMETGARALLLTHLNPKYDPQALLREARSAYPDARLAQPGMRVRV